MLSSDDAELEEGQGGQLSLRGTTEEEQHSLGAALGPADTHPAWESPSTTPLQRDRSSHLLKDTKLARGLKHRALCTRATRRG